jgi:hypothetical protein
MNIAVAQVRAFVASYLFLLVFSFVFCVMPIYLWLVKPFPNAWGWLTLEVELVVSLVLAPLMWHIVFFARHVTISESETPKDTHNFRIPGVPESIEVDGRELTVDEAMAQIVDPNTSSAFKNKIHRALNERDELIANSTTYG